MKTAISIALKETASSNFIFGWLVGWLLAQRHEVASGELMKAEVV